MMRFPIREDILAMPPIDVPAEPPELLAAHLGLPAERIIKLDANENPYGPSPRARQALSQIDAHRYPDPAQKEMRSALASYAGVKPSQVIATNGGDELIAMVMQMALEPGDQFIDAIPSFGMYAWAALLARGAIISIPRLRERGWAVDIDAVLTALSPRTRLIILCSPNNPTGNLTPREDIERLLETGLLVVVDEAYYEFSGETVVPLLADHPNLLIMRTMSKWAGLAGLRVGYALAHPELVRHMDKIRQPFNVNLAAQAAVVASVQDKDYLLANVQRIIDERDRLYTSLRGLPFLTVYPSRANFILAEVSGIDASVLKDALAQEGLFIRTFQRPHLPNAIRITVGTPEQTAAAVEILQRVGRCLGLL
jgi:histidinol-phosphate aminotransferase